MSNSFEGQGLITGIQLHFISNNRSFGRTSEKQSLSNKKIECITFSFLMDNNFILDCLIRSKDAIFDKFIDLTPAILKGTNIQLKGPLHKARVRARARDTTSKDITLFPTEIEIVQDDDK